MTLKAKWIPLAATLAVSIVGAAPDSKISFASLSRLAPCRMKSGIFLRIGMSSPLWELKGILEELEGL